MDYVSYIATATRLGKSKWLSKYNEMPLWLQTILYTAYMVVHWFNLFCWCTVRFNVNSRWPQNTILTVESTVWKKITFRSCSFHKLDKLKLVRISSTFAILVTFTYWHNFAFCFLCRWKSRNIFQGDYYSWKMHLSMTKKITICQIWIPHI